MCGIAGKISLSKENITEHEINLMTDRMIHRGPNDSGIYISKNKKVGLGSRRLAIIDLSKKGHQPMNYLNRYWITTNGEMYNFQEERKKLTLLGYKFKTNSDTEVILALYHEYKEKCLDHIRGMFAFCIYDELNQTLFLARDRIGVKPLKYFQSDNLFIFASEAKAILTQKEYKKNPDFKALYMYLTYGYIPSPLTGFDKIEKLEPGHYLTINLKTKKVFKKRYWEPSFTDKWDLSEKEWGEIILGTLAESTRLRLISDVPLGAYLSGGVDSSAVVAMMALTNASKINTFTVVFEEQQWTEAKYARLISDKYNTNHTELLVKPEDAEILPQISYFYEEPYADSGAIVNYMVNKLARKDVTVVLNGDGGDETFAGYPNRYMRLKRDVDFYSWITAGRPLALTGLKVLNKLKTNVLLERGTSFLEKSKLPLYQKFHSYNQIFSIDDISKLILGKLKNYYSESVFEPVENTFNLFKGKDLKDAGLKFDLLYWLPDDLLAKSDLMSMANSIEARSPFLDYKMIELSGKIPFKLKVKNGESKYILKKALEQIVPKENLYRTKMGFGIPLSAWFTRDLNKYTRKVLLNKKSLIQNYLNIIGIEEMLDKHNSKQDYAPKLWALLMLEIWLNTFFST